MQINTGESNAMSPSYLFLPMLVQVMLTMSVFVRLGAAKSKAASDGEVNEERRALHDDAWPEPVIKLNNNIRNQFELPVLFYAVCFILWALNTTNVFVHAVAWLFVISRIAHSMIHTGSNLVPLRRKVFTLGFLLLVILVVTAFISVVMHGAA